MWYTKEQYYSDLCVFLTAAVHETYHSSLAPAQLPLYYRSIGRLDATAAK